MVSLLISRVTGEVEVMGSSLISRGKVEVMVSSLISRVGS